MDFSQMIIKKHENTIKTFVHPAGHTIIKDRFSSGIIVVLCGKLRFVFGNTYIDCDKDHPIFIPKNASYYFECSEYAESLLFNFQTDCCDIPPSPLPKINHITAREYFDRIDSLSSKINISTHLIFAAYYEFFAEIFPVGATSDKSEEYVNMAEKIMIKNFSDANLDMDDISKKTNISKVYLRKLFVKYRGMPPSKYLTKIRMEKAKIYLWETRSVSETALSVGYSDIYQFSRAFKNYFGMSPTKYMSNPSNM